MQAVKLTFVQTDRARATAGVDWNADFGICPGHSSASLAKYPHMLRQLRLFVLDKQFSSGIVSRRRRRLGAPPIKGVAAVQRGTSGAEFGSNHCAGAAAPSHRRAGRGVSAGFLAAQLRRSSVETSRALLLLPPSLVRSGALRSDIYSSAPASGRVAARSRVDACRAADRRRAAR